MSNALRHKQLELGAKMKASSVGGSDRPASFAGSDYPPLYTLP
jgi:hypothetical protein